VRMSTNMMSRAGGGTTTANAAATAPANDAAEYSKNMAGKKKKATFECQHCARKFATRSHLVRHSRVHTGERRYACDYPGCEMRCSRKDNLQQQLVLPLSIYFAIISFLVHPWSLFPTRAGFRLATGPSYHPIH
jgi:hypothetical protein